MICTSQMTFVSPYQRLEIKTNVKKTFDWPVCHLLFIISSSRMREMRAA